jgi:hypothetical protein
MSPLVVVLVLFAWTVLMLVLPWLLGPSRPCPACGLSDGHATGCPHTRRIQ